MRIQTVAQTCTHANMIWKYTFIRHTVHTSISQSILCPKLVKLLHLSHEWNQVFFHVGDWLFRFLCVLVPRIEIEINFRDDVISLDVRQGDIDVLHLGARVESAPPEQTLEGEFVESDSRLDTRQLLYVSVYCLHASRGVEWQRAVVI